MDPLRELDERIEMLRDIRRHLRADTPAEVFYALEDLINEVGTERVRVAEEREAAQK